MRITLLTLLFVFALQQAKAQGSLPPAYNGLKTDAARMEFIIKTINDSLRGDNLVHVFEWAQTGYQVAEKNSVDSLRGSFLVYMGKAYNYYYEKHDSAIYYYKQALPFFQNKLSNDHAIAMRSIMDCYAELGMKDSCFKYLDLALNIMHALPDSSTTKFRLAEVIGTNYSWFGMYKSAIRLYDVARNGYLGQKNYQGVGMVLSHIAFIHEELEENDNAINYWKNSLPYLQGYKRPYATNCANIASAYYNLQQFDSAKYYLDQSDSIATEAGMLNQLSINDKVKGEILTSAGMYAGARPLLNKSLSYFEENQDPRNIILSLLAISNLDSSTGQSASALQQLKRALAISREAGLKAMELRTLQALSNISGEKGNYKEAWNYQSLYMSVNDSLNKEKAATELADFEIFYKTQQKEQEILLLKQENDIKKLQLKSSRQSIFFYTGGFAILLLALGVIFYQRGRRHKIETEKMKAEMQTQVLRSQMNPHFIFNCLNSIENFVMLSEKRKASDYLNKFSRLIRDILDSSRNEVVPLAKDMEALGLYVELEQLRFNNKFNFQSFIDPALAGGDYRVPALLIQPYVENAILHGLANSDESNLHLTVMACLQEDKIKYTIQDNGVGRNKAAEYNSHNKPHHKSVGLKITEQRINVFNGEKTSDSILITDLYDNNRNPEGTKVEITIKAT